MDVHSSGETLAPAKVKSVRALPRLAKGQIDALPTQQRMLAVGQRSQKQPGSVTADPGAQQLIDLDDSPAGKTASHARTARNATTQACKR